jgi:L-amino acid N-acyltransferase YncA
MTVIDTALSLRPASAADADAICAIWNPIIRDTVVTFNPVERNPADIVTMITDRQGAGHAFIIAEAGGHILGFATYAQFRAGLGYARSMEHTINLSPGARGRGVGAHLLQGIEVHARAYGHHVMVAAITGGNVGSIRFHAVHGYRQVGRMPQVGWKFDQHHDLVLMQKIL